MPRVPTYDNFKVMPEQIRTVEMQAATPRVDPGARASALGQGLQQAGAKVLDIEIKALEKANQVRIDDAINRALEAEMRLAYDKDVGYTNQRGLSALERSSGLPLADEYGEEYGRAIEQIAAGLGNDYQREAFAQASQRRLAAFRQGAIQHESREFQNYTLSVREGTIANRIQMIGLNYNNPELIDESITSIRASAYDAARLQGKSAIEAQENARRMVSQAHRTAVAAALQNNDVMFADKYMRRYSKDMTADDLLQAQGAVTKEVDMHVATNVATQVMGGYAPRIVPGDFDRLTNIVMGIESGGRRFDTQGNLLEGPMTRFGTAKGEMQVLDSTNLDPGYGVKPAQDDSPEERARVGRDYLAAMVREYKGDVAKAMAAYNWGPGNLDKAITEHGDNWLEHAPQETRNYVTRGMREFGQGAGAGPRPTLAEIKADLRADPQLANNPTRLRHAESVVDAQFREIEAARAQAEGEALDAAYKGLYANNGNMQGLPADVRMRIPGDKLPAVLSFAEKMAKQGGAVHSPEAWATILSMPRDELAKLTPLEFFQAFRPVLDDAHLEKGYALIAQSQGSADVRQLDIVGNANRVKRAAQSAGIIPWEDKPDDKQLQALAQFEQTVQDRVAEFERLDLQGKRPATGEELQKILDGILADTAFVPRFGRDRETPVALLTPEDQANAYLKVGNRQIRLSDIAREDRGYYISRLEAAGITPTEERIATLWAEDNPPERRDGVRRRTNNGGSTSRAPAFEQQDLMPQ